jgi:hypothetical protein
VEQRGERMQGNKSHKQIGDQLVRHHRLFGQNFVQATGGNSPKK